VIEALGRNGLGDAFLDWGGGLVWAPVPPGVEVAAHTIRDVATKEGGHATLWRGPDGMRAAVEVFQPPLPPLAALTRRVKAGFDPHGILNPGRMYAGI
jgi:glycolate oxidase FAD binding subunit